MDKKDQIFRISLLMSKYLSGEISVEEQAELDGWKDESEHHRLLFAHLCAEDMLMRKKELYAHTDVGKAFRRFLRARQIAGRDGKIYFWRKCAKYAAVLLLPVCMTLFYFYRNPPAAQLTEMLPGRDDRKDKPILLLSDGKRIVLDSLGLRLQEKNGMAIKIDNNRMVYDARPYDADSLIYNTLEVPLYGDFKLELSDGTKVHLNAGSSLRFPVSFGKDSRTVYASGELCFEVAKEKQRPFQVILNHMKVEVLGTVFNVNAYKDENFAEVTLVEGQVVAHADGGRYELRPDQQFQLNKNNGEARIRSVVAKDYLAWINGEYVFKEKTMSEVARILERWYDVKIHFMNRRCAELVYTGVISRDQSVSGLIALFEKSSSLRCKMEGREVFIF